MYKNCYEEEKYKDIKYKWAKSMNRYIPQEEIQKKQ